jgi:pyruvate formate lyase activating enzyme
MFFAGLERLSLIDFPGRLSAVGFTYGCNMRCPYCHNPELVTKKLDTNRIFKEEDVLAFLKTRIGKLDGFVITGGEPTMHKGLPDFLEKVKDLGFETKLDSNGTDSRMLAKLFERNLIDYHAMDVKYGDELYQQGLNDGLKITDIQKSIDLIMKHSPDYEFRTTVTRSIHDIKRMHEIGKMVKGAKRYFIQNFKAGKSIDPSLDNSDSFTEKELGKFKKIMLGYVDEVEVRFN